MKALLCRVAHDRGAQEEAERQLVTVKKLKAEVTRKEGMLKATQSELDKVCDSEHSCHVLHAVTDDVR